MIPLGVENSHNTSAPYFGYQRIRRTLIVSYLTISILLISVGSWLLLLEKNRLLTDAKNETQTIARALEEHVLRTFSSVDLSLQFTAHKVGQLGTLDILSPAEVVPILKEQVANLPFSRSIYLYDRKGKGHSTARGTNTRHLNGYEHEQIRFHLMGGDDRLFIGRAVKGPVTNQLNIPVSRQFRDSNNKLAGIIGCAVELSYFEQFYDSLKLLDGATFALVRADGAVLVRFPHWDGMPNDVSHTKLYKEGISRSDSGSFSFQSTIDKRKRIFSFRRAGEINLFVVYSVDVELILAPWFHQISTYAISVALFLGALFGLLLIVLHQLSKRQHAETQITSIVESANDGIVSINQHGEITLANPAVLRMFGYKSSDILGKPISQLIPDHLAFEYVDELADLSSTTTSPFENSPTVKTGISSSGHGFPIETTLAQQKEESGWITTVVIRDITERRATENALRANYELLDRVFSTTNFCIVYLDSRFNFIRVNKAYAEICKHPEEFFVGQNYFQVFPESNLRSTFQEVVVSGQSSYSQFQSFNFSEFDKGSEQSWDWTIQPLHGLDGAVESLLFTLVDVTDRARTTKLIRDSETRLRLAAQAGNICFWDCVLGNANGYFTNDLNLQLGYTKEELPSTHEDWLERLHPDEREHAWKKIAQYLSGNVSDYQIECSLRHKSGSFRWIYSKGEITRDIAGGPNRLAGCHVDVTDLKQAQRELAFRAAQRRLNELLARLGNSSAIPEEAMQVCLAQLCSFGQWAVGHIGFYESSNTQNASDSAIWHSVEIDRYREFISQTEETMHSQTMDSPWKELLEGKEPIWIVNLEKAQNFSRQKVALSIGLRSVFAFPIFVSGQVVAFLELFSDTERIPNQNLIATSEAIGAQLARLIERNRADQLKARLAAVVESSNDAIFTQAINGTILLWNSTAERLYGWSANEAIGQPISLIIPNEEYDALRRVTEKVVNGLITYPTDMTHVSKDGTHMHIQVTYSPVHNSRGDVVAISNTVRDVTDTKSKEKALRELNSRLRKLSQRLREMEEKERERMSRELHDRIGQGLSTLNLMLGMLRNHVASGDQMEVRAGLEDMQQLLVSVIGSVRNVMADLRPPALEQFGILAALKDLAADYTRRTHIPVLFNSTNPAWRPSQIAETAIFRIVQEALNNIAKHASAKQVVISERSTAEEFEISIADDGIGFQVGQLSTRPGWGLTIMQERAESASIGFHLDSAPNRGTRIRLTVKIAHKNDKNFPHR